MSTSLNNRFPYFEVAMLAVVAGLGWAAFRAYDALREQPPSALRAPAEPVRPHPPRVDDLLKVQDLTELQNKLMALADQLHSGVAGMRSALEAYVQTKNRGEIARYQETAKVLPRWIARQHEELDLRRIESLKNWLRNTGGTLPSSEQLVQTDFVADFARAETAVSNYIAAIRIVPGQLLTPDIVQSRLTHAQAAEQALLNAGIESRRHAELMAATAANWSARWAEVGRTAAPVLPPESTGSPTLQKIFYGLIIALVLQCALLVIAFHRRLVVTPLHHRLIESHSAAEHQKKLNHFSRLATALAHEIRNPLTAISIRLFTLQKSLLPGTPEHGDSSLIRNEVDRLDQVLKNFLKLARPAESRPGLVAPETLLREVRDLLAPQLQRQEITLKCEAGAGGALQGDPVQLKQVLINLVQNAADSIGRDGTVILRARAGQEQLRDRTASAVILEVEDNGAGIAPDVQERLFDPFFSTKESGTGLGLPIAARIIDQHRGRIEFETQPGRGTTFRVMLPAVPELSLHG